MRDHRLHPVEDAVEVDVDDLLPRLRRQLLERTSGAARDPGVVPEDVDAPELGERALGRRADGVEVPDVGDGAERAAAGGADTVDRLLDALRNRVEDDDCGALAREQSRSGRADPRTGAGDHGDLAGELAAHGIGAARPSVSSSPARARQQRTGRRVEIRLQGLRLLAAAVR